jgi:hypothetical protein
MDCNKCSRLMGCPDHSLNQIALNPLMVIIPINFYQILLFQFEDLPFLFLLFILRLRYLHLF